MASPSLAECLTLSLHQTSSYGEASNQALLFYTSLFSVRGSMAAMENPVGFWGCDWEESPKFSGSQERTSIPQTILRVSQTRYACPHSCPNLYRCLNEQTRRAWSWKYGTASEKTPEAKAATDLAAILQSMPIHEFAEQTGQGFLWEGFTLPEAVLWRDISRTAGLWKSFARTTRRTTKLHKMKYVLTYAFTLLLLISLGFMRVEWPWLFAAF